MTTMAKVLKEKQESPLGESEAIQHGVHEKGESITLAPPPTENIVTRDGFRLHPQPTSDPMDPLNWSNFQKHTILAIVMFKYEPIHL